MKTKIEVCKSIVINHEKVTHVRSLLPDDQEIKDLAEIFKALGDPTRLRIMLSLAKEELCVCDLAALINVSVSAISHQLRLLKGMKLVNYRKAGKMVYYSLDDDHVETLILEATKHVRE